MSVTVNDRIESEEIGRYDVLVTCTNQVLASSTASSTFNVTLTLPPSGGTSVDRNLEVIIDDANTQRRVYLASFDLHRPQQPRTLQVPISGSSRNGFTADYLSVNEVEEEG
jgi:hypothetical protein